MDKYFGSTLTLTSLLSPAFNHTLLHPTNRFGGSPASEGSAAYTSAISPPVRDPVFFTVKLRAVSFPAVTFNPEYAKVVYESPYPNGNRTAFFSVSYHLYPTCNPSSYFTLNVGFASPVFITAASPVCPGPGWVSFGCGNSASLFGKVIGNFALGFASPFKMSTTASAPLLPPYHASKTAPTLSSHGMVTAVPVSSTTIVFGFAAATASINSSCFTGSDKFGRSIPSLSH